MSQQCSATMALQPLHLVEEITHRVVNEYTEAIATLSLAARASGDIGAQAVLISAADRLRAHVEAHRALQAPLGDGISELSDYIAQVCACLSRAPLALRGVMLSLDIDKVWLDADRCWRVGLIVAELIRNAARHGFDGGPGAVRVEITQSLGLVSCLVSDNGSAPASPPMGRGRRLVSALAAELGGAVAWTFTPLGCRVHLEFPADAPLRSVAGLDQHGRQ